MSYYFRVTITGFTVKLGIKLRRRVEWEDMIALHRRVDSLTHRDFETVRTGSPSFSYQALTERVQSTHSWEVVDENTRTDFVGWLKCIASQLAALHYIDPIDADIDKILKGIIRDRNTNPIISTGTEFYRLQLVKESPSFRMSIDDEFRAAVAEQIELIRQQYESRLEDELEERLKTQDRHPYALTQEDVVDGGGWCTWMRNGFPILAKLFIYSPKRLLYGNEVYTLKPEITEKAAQKCAMVYDSYANSISIRRFEKRLPIFITPHSYSGDGSLCTGTAGHPDKAMRSNLDALKEYINKVISMQETINMNSMVSGILPGFGKLMYGRDTVEKIAVKATDVELIDGDRTIEEGAVL